MKNMVLQLLVLVFLIGCSGGSSSPSPSIDDAGPAEPDGSGFDLPLYENGELALDIPQQTFELQEGGNTPYQLDVEIRRQNQSGPAVELGLVASDSNLLDQVNYWFDNYLPSGTGFTAKLNIQLSVDVAPLKEHVRELYLVANDGTGRTEKNLLISIKPVQVPDVYLLIGQSNMSGFTEPDSKNAAPGGPDESHPRIKQLNVQANFLESYPSEADFTNEDSNTEQPLFIAAEDPLHRPRSAGSSSKSGTSVGIGLAFAKAALVDTTQEIFLVPAAWSGSAFCDNGNGETGWNARQPSDSSLRGSLLVDRALTRLNMTLRETGGIFRGILWHQGESDSNNDTCADLYAENLQLLFARIRTEARVDLRGVTIRGAAAVVPMVLGTMSTGDDERGEFSFFGSAKLKVDQVHRSIAQWVPFSDFSNNDDLIPPAYPCGKDSCIHFGAAANREQGYRMYQALKRVIESL